MWFNKRKEEEKLNPWLHTHLVHEEQTQSRDFQVFGSIQTHRNTPSHTPCCSACWQSQHCPALQTGRRRPPKLSQLSQRRIIHRSCLWIGRSGWMPASSITFLFLILTCISELQTRMFWSSPLWASIQPSSCDSWVCWWNLIALIEIKAAAPSDDEKLWRNQSTCGKVWSLMDL